MKKSVVVMTLILIGCLNIYSQELLFENQNIKCMDGSNLINDVAGKNVSMNSVSAIGEYGWPFIVNNDEGVFIINYVDHNSGNGFTDYEGGNIHGYNVHLGTDFSLYSIVDMDKGVPIIAVEGGTVIKTTFNQFDRNIQQPYIGTGNGITIEHDDGTRAIYWHLRKNSVTVEPGEQISKGQVLALTGSSGWTPIPHLHLEFWVLDGSGSASSIRDPFSGSVNTLPSMWDQQTQYVGDDQLKVLEMGIFTRETAWGNESTLDINDMKLKLTAPSVVGSDEPIIGTWMLLQGYGSNNITIEIRKPDGSVYRATTYTLSSSIQYGYYAISDPWSNISNTDFGEWSINLKRDSQILKSQTFVVNNESVYPPRFWPIAGKSFRINGNVQLDTLRVIDYDNPVSYKVINGSSSITLTDSILTVAGSSNQSHRSYYFRVVAENNFGFADTMWYHLVDPSKPLDDITSVNNDESEIELKNDFELYQNYPNPFNPSTTIRFSIPHKGAVQVKIYNQLGQEISELINKEFSVGSHSITWDGKNEYGLSVSSGTYFARVTTMNAIRSIKMLLLK